jgi:BlaR1 peptidase M56
MIDPSAVFDAYLDVNILLALSCLLWSLTAAVLRAAGLGHAYTAQLRTLRFAILAIVLSPLAVAGLTLAARKTGLVLPNANLSDFILAQYLQGRFDMDPANLQAMLGARRHLSTAYATGGSPAVFWVGLVLVTGFGLSLARLACGIAKLSRLIGDSFLWRRFGRLELRLSDRVGVPFSTRSFSRRIVVLPTAMLAEPDDLRIALGHELQHLRQRDVEWEIFLECLRPLFFWNPAFHLWKRQVSELRELSCDRQVVARRGYDVAAYCRCLLRVCRNSVRRRRLFEVATPGVALVEDEGRLFRQRSAEVLRQRMVSLIDGKAEPHPGVLMALMLGPLAALTLVAALSIQRPGDWSHDRLMLSTIINLDRLEAMNAASTLKQPGH